MLSINKESFFLRKKVASPRVPSGQRQSRGQARSLRSRFALSIYFINSESERALLATKSLPGGHSWRSHFLRSKKLSYFTFNTIMTIAQITISIKKHNIILSAIMRRVNAHNSDLPRVTSVSKFSN